MENPARALQPPIPERLSRERGWLIGAGLLWLALVTAGTGWIMKFETTPGPTGGGPAEWPADSQLARTPGQATLVMLAHPRCACTRASLAELATLMETTHGALTATVLFYYPKGASPAWAQTELWRTASAIPGVSVVADEENHEASRFGGETSGGTLLFDAGGRLVFQGGITDARGQFGESSGRLALTALLSGRATPLTQTAVYGCPLRATTASLSSP